MTGVQYAQQLPSGLITLTYSDGSTEARSSEMDLQEFESFGAIVSYVQGFVAEKPSDCGWYYYDSNGIAIGPFATEAEALAAAREE
jgi:hypothetical protein